jgi:sugar fermentation stimulation protein A
VTAKGASDWIATFPEPLVDGVIVRRPNRFLIDVEVDGGVQSCHCPTTGRIGNLVLDGLPCLLSQSAATTRKTRYTVEAVCVDPHASDPQWIGINQNAANRYIEQALRSGHLDQIVPVRDVARERTLGGSRVDFLVNSDTYIEVKTPLQNLQVTLPAGAATRKQAPFDSTDRMVRHLTELGASLAAHERAVLIVCFLYDNPGFAALRSTRSAQVAATVRAAIAQGVQIWQVNLLLNRHGVRIGRIIDLTARFA